MCRFKENSLAFQIIRTVEPITSRVQSSKHRDKEPPVLPETGPRWLSSTRHRTCLVKWHQLSYIQRIFDVLVIILVVTHEIQMQRQVDPFSNMVVLAA